MRTEEPDVQALVVVDVQRAFVEGRSAVPDAERLLSAIKIQLAAARAARAQVVYLQNDGTSETGDAPGTDGWELALEPDAGELVIRKAKDDGFCGTSLEAVLREGGVAVCSIVGVLSEMCVAATARQALELGFGVVMAHDSHGTHYVPEQGPAAPGVPARLARRAAEWALGDEPCFVSSAADIRFQAP
ncbi:MAG: isochorismatase family protein [Actinomycetota bacterium]|nr:isochorismatase family protein [Actinomycetota bacterium]